MAGSRVRDLHGVTAHGVNRGCDVGVHVTVLGSLPIRHELNPSTGTDYYAVFSTVGAMANIRELTVKVKVQASGSRHHRAKAQVVRGGLEMFFAGGLGAPAFVVPTMSAASLTFSASAAGICHVGFSFS